MSSFCGFMLRRTLKRCHGDTMLNSRRYRTLPFPVLYTDCSFKHTTGLYYSFITPRNEHELGVQVLRGDSVDVDVSEKSGHAQMWGSWRGEARRGKTRLSPHRNYTETGLSPKSSSGHEAKRNFQSVIQRTRRAEALCSSLTSSLYFLCVFRVVSLVISPVTEKVHALRWSSLINDVVGQQRYWEMTVH